MKKYILYSLFASFILTGCTSKMPAIDATAEPKYKLNEYENIQHKELSYPQTNNGKIEPIKIKSSNKKNEELIEIIDEIKQSSETVEKSTLVNSNIESIYFDFNQFNIKEDMDEVLNKNLKFLTNKKIRLEGNCDEFGSDEYNMALGLKRANSVKSALITKGLNPNNISMVSYGESNQVCTQKTEECFMKNRRVDFSIEK